MAMLSRFVAIFFALLILATSGIDYYIIYMLNQETKDEKRIRVFAGLTAGILLTLLVALICVCIFAFEIIGRLFAGKAGLMAMAFVILIFVLMAMNFAILPKVKAKEYDEAKKIAAIAGVIGTLLFVIAMIIFITKSVKKGKEKKEYKNALSKAMKPGASSGAKSKK